MGPADIDDEHLLGGGFHREGKAQLKDGDGGPGTYSEPQNFHQWDFGLGVAIGGPLVSRHSIWPVEEL